MLKRTRYTEWGMFLAAIVLVVISFPVRKYLDSHLNKDQKISKTELAIVTQSEGKVLLRHNDQGQFDDVSADQVIQNKDQLRVERGGLAKIRLNTGSEIELTENTDVVFELWRSETEDSPLYLHFFAGDYQVLFLDHVRPIYVSMNDNLFLLQNKTKDMARRLSVRQMPSALNHSSRESVVAAIENEDDVKPATQNSDGPPSNAYIDQTIGAQKSLFQKCQTNSIRNKKQSNGQVVAGLTIAPTGLVSEAKVISSSFKDLELPNCAIDVIRRIRFRAYQGDAIVRSYPLQFE